MRSFDRRVALLMAGAMFMEFLDGTIIQTAAPSIAADFGISAIDVNIAMVAYLAAVAAGVPASRWAAGRIGIRSLFLVSVALFTVASLACALAPDLTILTIARAAQGLGGAFMVPVGRLAVLRAVESRDLLDAMAFLTWPALVAPVIAPALGGLLADTVGWRWIFLLNVPLGIVAVLLGVILLRGYRERSSGRFDIGGFVLLASALVLISIGAERFASAHPVDWLIGAAFVVGGSIALLAGVLASARRVDPVVDWNPMRAVTFRVGNVSGAVYRVVITAAPLMLTLLFQEGFGWSATLSGLLVMAVFVGNVGVKPFTTRIIRRWGFRTTIVVSSILGAASLLAIAFVDRGTPVVILGALLVVSGALRSIGFTAYGSIQFADVPQADLSNANTLSSTVQQLATALGVAVAALLVQVGEAVSALGLGGPYRWAFIVGAALMTIPVIGAARLAPDAGAHATTR